MTEIPTKILTESIPLDATMRALAEEHQMTHADVARLQLGITEEELHDHIWRGNLTAVSARGDTYVATEHVKALSWELTQHRTSELVTLREPMTALLRAFLADRPLVETYGEALHNGHPLLCARRGRPRAGMPDLEVGDLGGRGVAVPAQVLRSYADDHPEIHPELGRLPIGPALAWRFCTLDGIEEQGHITPSADDRGHSRRVRGWLRLDPQVWRPTVPPQMADMIRSDAGRG